MQFCKCEKNVSHGHSSQLKAEMSLKQPAVILENAGHKRYITAAPT